MSGPVARVDALVVGGGPAGLAAATALRTHGADDVLVVEREDEAGGVPRHCHHSGFGVRDLHRVLQGPVYARRWVDRASDAGAAIWTRTMVTGWSADGHAEVTGPEGRRLIRARAVVLATGARERARAALLVPGSRPTGVFTTGQLQQWVYRERLPVGRRALVVGAEHVSYSAVLTLREAGVRTVALATGLERPQTFGLFDLVTRHGLGVPVWTETTVAGVYGKDHVEMVRLRGPGGQVREVAVDAVVFTGQWIPDHELARTAGLSMDRGTNGPACDARGRTSLDGVFAAGNLVHPVETADVAAQRATAVGTAAAAWLRQGSTRPGFGDSLTVRTADPLQWVVPNLLRPGGRSREPVLLRSTAFLDHPRLRVEQGGRVLATYRLRHMVPNRSHHVPADWQRAVDHRGGDVAIRATT